MIEFAFYFSYYSFLVFGVAFLAVIWLTVVCGAIELLLRIVDKTNYRKGVKR